MSNASNQSDLDTLGNTVAERGKELAEQLGKAVDEAANRFSANQRQGIALVVLFGSGTIILCMAFFITVDPFFSFLMNIATELLGVGIFTGIIYFILSGIPDEEEDFKHKMIDEMKALSDEIKTLKVQIAQQRVNSETSRSPAQGKISQTSDEN